MEFMQRAFLAGMMLAPLLATLGSFMTLRKMSFFADGIAHASLLGIALALICGATPFLGAIIVGVVFGLVVFFLERYARLASDAVVGVIFTAGMALGIILISLQPGYQPDLISFLFGNILSITWANIWTIFGVSVTILLTIFVFFRHFILIALNDDMAWTSGVNTKRLDALFYIMLSLTVVLGVKLLGVVLVSALLIIPSITAKIVAHSFYTYVSFASMCAFVAFVVGLIGSYYLDLPSGASIVMVAVGIFVMTFFGKVIISGKRVAV